MADTSFFFITGEASGDLLGSRLIRSLREEFGEGISLGGIGGEAMLEGGLGKSLFPMEELSLMGLLEILPGIFHLKKRIGETVEAVLVQKPDVLLTIDSPDFCFRVAAEVRKRASGKCPKIIHYVAPSVWAWRGGRAKKVASFLDGILCLLPFEPPYFEREGLPARFVGHPVIESGIPSSVGTDRECYRREMNISPGDRIVGLLPGSRRSEIKKTGLVLFEAARRLQARRRDLHFVIPTLPHLEPLILSYAGGLTNVRIETGQNRKRGAFAAFDAAMATSGTVGLELAVAGVPHVIAYRMNPLTWQIVRRVIKVRHAHIANIILGREAVPEFIQESCKPGPIAGAVLELLDNPELREAQREEFGNVRDALGAGDETPPSAKAAAFIREFVKTGP